MSEPTIEQLASRIAQLEQRLRSVALVLLVVIVFAALQLWQVWGHKNVEPESFALRSSDGKIRAMLSLGADGAPRLGMLDAGDGLIPVGAYVRPAGLGDPDGLASGNPESCVLSRFVLRNQRGGPHQPAL